MKKNSDIYFIILIILFEFLFYLIEPFISNIIYYVLMPMILITSIFFYILYKKNNNDKKYIYYFLIFLSIVLKNVYIINTSVYDRGHDIFEINETGHLGYIYYLFQNGRLPLSNDWQFYQPPLFHMCAALFLKINKFLKLSLYNGIEGIQYLNVIFTAFTIIIWNKIIDNIDLKNKFYPKLLIICYPVLFLISGSINNDCLLTMFESLIIYCLIIWNNNDSIKNTIILALVTGLCVMTKANGAIMAVPILYIFIKKIISFIKSKNVSKIKSYFFKYILFGIISLPIGLWFQIRSIIKFSSVDIPNPGDWLYIGDVSFFNRFIKISFSEIFDKIFCNVYDIDKNMFAYITKSSIFGEYSFNVSKIICLIFLFINLVLIIISLIEIIRYIFNKKKDVVVNILFISWIVSMISYIIFNIKYPFFCSYDFRYIVITAFIGIIFIFYNNLMLNNKIASRFIKFISILFSVISMIFYSVLIF